MEAVKQEGCQKQGFAVSPVVAVFDQFDQFDRFLRKTTDGQFDRFYLRTDNKKPQL